MLVATLNIAANNSIHYISLFPMPPKEGRIKSFFIFLSNNKHHQATLNKHDGLRDRNTAKKVSSATASKTTCKYHYT